MNNSINPKTPAQALAFALALAVSAPNDAKASALAGCAESIAAGMDPVDAQNVRDAVEACLVVLAPQPEEVYDYTDPDLDTLNETLQYT